MRKTFITFVIVAALFAINFNLYGFTRYSVASGNWNSTSTWSSSSGGSSGASVPVAGDVVYIEGDNITVTANASCASITFTVTGSTLTVNSSMTLTVSGAVTLNNLAAANITASITGAGLLSCASVSIGNGTAATSNNSTYTHTMTSTISNFTVSGNLVINSYYVSNNRIRNGVFNLASGITTVNGSVTTSNANSANTSTLSLATGAQTGTLVLGGATPFTISGTGTSTTTLNGTGATVNYNDAGPQAVRATTYTNLTLAGSGAKTTTGATVNGTLSMQETATTTGTVATYGAAATLEYMGSSAQTTGTEFPATWSGTGGVTINNANGVTLNGAKTITNLLTMTSGNITTGANILMLGTSTAVRGTLSYNSGLIITGSTGGFKRWFTNATVSNVYFPVGTSSTINMVTLSFTGAPTAGGSLTAKYSATNPGITAPFLSDAGYTVNRFSQKGYWQVDAADGLTGGTYSLSLRGQGFNPSGTAITNYAHLRILKTTNSGVNWILNGTHLDATGSNSDPTIQRTGLSGFSQFAMGGYDADGNPLDGPLPVELSAFTANVISRDVKLNWTTASELNNSGFEIERSEVKGQKSNEWVKAGNVTGNGTKATPTNYTFEDKKLLTGKYNYRLKQIDYNGNFEYHNLTSSVEISVPNKFDISQNYPNPFNPTTKIDFDLPYDGKVSIKLYDISGREVMTLVNETKTAGYYTVQMNGNNLSSGMYFFRITANGNGQNYVNIKKLVLLK